VRRVLEALKRNEIVFILGDNLRRGKVETLLFGQRVPSPRGPVSLALRSGAALVPMYLIRNYRGGLDLVVEPEVLLIRNGNVYEDVSRNTREIVRYLESLIGRYPDQWNWLTVRLRGVRAGAEAMRREEHDPISHTREVTDEPARDAYQRIGS
jgi:KDO2-lipid IV(A) lauroyltransferase